VHSIVTSRSQKNIIKSHGFEYNSFAKVILLRSQLVAKFFYALTFVYGACMSRLYYLGTGDIVLHSKLTGRKMNTEKKPRF
jgi:hypothetical protein